MITIKTRPYQGITPKVNPVYNGLPFVVDSNTKYRTNFKYIAELYINDTKVSELRHDPDISNANMGVFELGRIAENYLAYDINLFNAYSSVEASKTAKKYYVNFGEEYGRLVEITNWTSYNSGSRVTTKYPHNLRVGDKVLIQGSNIAAYNGYKLVTYASTTMFIISTPFTGTPNFTDMYIIEGEKIANFTSVTIKGVNYLAIDVNTNNSSTNNWSRFNEGDEVTINQDTITYPFYENTDWIILRKSFATVSGVIYQRYVLNAPFVGATPLATGSVISRSNYVFKNLVSTKLDGSIMFNGVSQYNDWLKWNPSFLAFSTTNASTKTFQSYHPTYKVDVCDNESYMVNSLGNEVMDGIKSNNNIRIETWSTPVIGAKNGTTSMASNILSLGSNSQMITIVGSFAGSYGIGDYITNKIGATTYSGRVVRVTSSGGNTYVYTDITTSATGSSILTQTIRVRYRDISSKSVDQQIPCGPKNLSAYSEFQDSSCYKYFVYGVYFQSTGYYSATNNRTKTSKEFEFTVKCSDCGNSEPIKIMWLNELGGFDFFKFSFRNDKTKTISRNIYDKKLLNVQTDNSYKYSTGDRGRTVYNTTSTQNIIARSSFLKQEQLDWINYLYESPEVYIVDDVNNELTPVIVKDSEVVEPNKANRGSAGSLYFYQITLVKANDRVIQRGGNIRTVSGGKLQVESVAFIQNKFN